MYCNKCGKENPDNSKFCKYCGNNIENPIKEGLEQQNKRLNKVEKNQNFMLWFFAITVILAAIIVVIVLLNKSSQKVEKSMEKLRKLQGLSSYNEVETNTCKNYVNMIKYYL